MDFRLYLFEGSGSLPSKLNLPAKFENKSLKTFNIVYMSYVNDLIFSIPLKFETTIFLGITRDFRMIHNSSFSLKKHSKSFSPKNACFFVAVV